MSTPGLIDSFRIDHTRLKRGVYVSRVDRIGSEFVTTYDIRVSIPPQGLDGAAVHTIEHIAATILRNGDESDRVVYFGPMGCLTGFYLILAGKPDIERVVGIVRSIFRVISEWTDDIPIPGATIGECGNPAFHNLVEARIIASDFVSEEFETMYPG